MAVTLANCVEYSQEQVFEYGLDLAEGQENPALAAHLQACEGCRALLNSYIQIGQNLKQLGSGDSDTAPLSESDTPATPERKTLGPYEIVGELGRGGMGVVFRARDPLLKRDVALKVMRRVLVRIAPVHFMGRNANGCEFFSMKLVSGRTLASALKSVHDGDARAVQELTMPRLLSIFERVCETIGFAHDNGVIHRDIKPGNIMIGAHGEVWVLDWGLAKVLRATDETAVLPADPASPSPPAQTAPGSAIGTPVYMSPEQARLEPLDERSDIYSLGAVLYEILTGRPPADGENPQAVMARVATGKIAPIASTRAGRCAPRALAAIAMKCLAFQGAERYAAVASLLQDLRAYAGGAAVSALPENRRERAQRYVRRHRTAFAAIAGVVTLLLIGVTIAALAVASEQSKARAALEAQQQAERTAHEKEKQAAAAEAKARDAENDKARRAQNRVAAFEPYSRAMDLLGRGQRFDEAEMLAKTALGIDHEFVEAQFAYAESLRRQGRSKDAADAFVAADELSRKTAGRSNLKAVLSAALGYENAGYWSKTFAALQRVDESGNPDPLADVCRVIRLCLFNKYAEARQLADRALERAPHLWEVHYAHANAVECGVKLGAIDPLPAQKSILDSLRAALTLAPHEGLLHFYLGNKIDGPQSLAELDKAIECESMNGYFRLGRAVKRRFAGDKLGAQEDVDRAQRTQLSPLLLKMYERRMADYAPDSAERRARDFALSKEIAAEVPDSPVRLANCVIVGLRQNNAADVGDMYAELQRRFPNDPGAITARVMSLNGDKRFVAAKDAIAQGLALYPYNTQLMELRARALFRDNQYSEAAAVIAQDLKWGGSDRFAMLKMQLDCSLRLNLLTQAREVLAELDKYWPERAAAELAQQRKELDASAK